MAGLACFRSLTALAPTFSFKITRRSKLIRVGDTEDGYHQGDVKKGQVLHGVKLPRSATSNAVECASVVRNEFCRHFVRIHVRSTFSDNSEIYLTLFYRLDFGESKLCMR